MPAIATAASQAGDPQIALRARLVWGALEHWEGSSAAAAERLRRVREEALESRFPIQFALASWWLVLAEMELGRYKDALAVAHNLLAHAEETGDRIALVRVHSALGTMYHEVGELTRSEDHSLRSLDLAEEGAAPAEERVPAVLTLAEVALDRGDVPGAVERLESVLSSLEADRWMSWRFGARHDFVRGKAALIADDVPAALAAASRMRERLAGSGSKKDLLRADWIEGEARLRSGDAAGSEFLERSQAEADQLGSPYLLAEVSLAVARSLPDRADAARKTAAAALKDIADSAPDDVVAGIARGPLAKELERLEAMTST
jgi:tetratricopeptide (TPR) repeat protein